MSRLVAAALILSAFLAVACAPAAVAPTPAPIEPAAAPTVVRSPTAPPATLASTEQPPRPTPTPQAQQREARIFYTRFDEAQNRSELRSVGSAGGDDRLLASSPGAGTIAGFAIAPGGSQIAYVTRKADGPAALHLLSADGASDAVLLEHRPETALIGFSPDGARLAYAVFLPVEGMGADGAIWVMTLADGQAHELVPRLFPFGTVAWRDSERLLYSISDGMGQLDTIYQVRADGDAPPTPLFPGVLRAVSPDGTSLLAGTEPIGHDIAADQRFAHALVALDGDAASAELSLALGAGATSWSPDGRTLLRAGPDALELLAVADGSTQARWPHSQKGALPMAATWDEAGEALLYAVAVRDPEPHTEIRRRPLDGGPEQVLVRHPGSDSVSIGVARR